MKFIDINNVQQYFDKLKISYNILNIIGNLNQVCGAAIQTHTSEIIYFNLFLDKQDRFNLRLSNDHENVKIF